jgi:hypothetical protein
MKFKIFEIYKFLQTLLRLEHWPERLAGIRQTDDRNLVWFGKIERKLAKFLMTTFAYRSSSYLFYASLA